MTKSMIYEFFPDEYLALERELRTDYHPKLVAILGQYPVDEVDIKLAQTAAYCEVILDGDYNLEDRIQLCRILKEKLILKRELPKTQVIQLFQ